MAFNNLTDYDSNFTIVNHVLKMDTTFPDNKGLWRAIESPVIHHMIYGLIIFIEIVIAALAGWVALFIQKHQTSRTIQSSKRMAILGLTLVHPMVYRFYDRWRRMVLDVAIRNANGQQAAFRLVILLALLSSSGTD